MSADQITTDWRKRLRDAGYVFLIIALASASAEVGVQYRSVFRRGERYMGVWIYAPRDFPRLLMHGQGRLGTANGHRVIDAWWGFLVFAAAGAILVKTPLLLVLVWFGGRAVTRATRRWPIGAAYPGAIAAGAVMGFLFFEVYESLLIRKLIWRVWLLYLDPGFAGCIAGGACGVLALAGRERRGGIAILLAEFTLIDLIILVTAWRVRYG